MLVLEFVERTAQQEKKEKKGVWGMLRRVEDPGSSHPLWPLGEGLRKNLDRECLSNQCNCDENRFGTEPPTAFNQCNLDLDINFGSRRDICLSAVCFS